jgi:hypothetical protein
MIKTCVFEQGDAYPKIAGAQMGDRRLAATLAEAAAPRVKKLVTDRHKAGKGPMPFKFCSTC